MLPVHGVERYLPRCLDSILEATPAGESRFEVIAVDDLSPDRCGEILDDYAARDRRLRVLHLPENQGLGGARTAALPEVRGEYVWFVDSDDWLPDGTVSALVDELAQESKRDRPADVLLTDFVHAYPDGGTEPNPWRHVLVGSPLVEGATVAEHPALFRTVMSVWNKVFRREFLTGLGVSFGRGFYEDISVTYPALLAAERLRYLDRPCYFYRRGRAGAITSTASPSTPTRSPSTTRSSPSWTARTGPAARCRSRCEPWSSTAPSGRRSTSTTPPGWSRRTGARTSSAGSPSTSPATARPATASRAGCAACSTGWPRAARGSRTRSCGAPGGCRANSSAGRGPWRRR
ncbi:glycosyltransferase family 2 protein [Kitasatospora aburaviensis]